MTGVSTALLTIAVFFLAAWSLLAVIRAPVYLLWKPGIAATEWGHWLAAVSGALAVYILIGPGPAWAGILAWASAVLFLSPLVRAVVLAPRLPRLFDGWTPPGSPEGDYGKSTRIVPLSLARVWHVPIPGVERITLDYAEVGGQQLSLDFYRPRKTATDPPAPVVVCVHAGSWRSGDRSELTGFNRYLASRGIGVAAIDYRLAPAHPFPAGVDDVLRAVEFTRSMAPEHGCAPDRVILAGRSAGGHLALSAAYDRRLAPVRGVIALYAPTDLEWSWINPAPRRLLDSNGVIRDFLGGTLEDMPDVFRAASPLHQVSPHCPPTLLVHGGKDELVSRLQSSRLAHALAAAGVRHQHVELPWGNHAMEANLAGPSGQITMYLIERFVLTTTLG